MTKRNQDFEANVGDDIVIRDTVTEDGSARNLTNHTAQVTVSPYVGAEPTLQFSDSDSRFAFSDAANGELQAELDAGDTADLDPGEYYYEIELVNATGGVHTVTTGTITLHDSY